MATRNNQTANVNMVVPLAVRRAFQRLAEEDAAQDDVLTPNLTRTFRQLVHDETARRATARAEGRKKI